MDAYVCLDELRRSRGSRSGRRGNDDVLREGLARLDTALAAGGTTVWDATCLTPRRRARVHAVARHRNALVTHAVTLVAEDELTRRNAARAHPVPPEVLAAQLRRFVPPLPGSGAPHVVRRGGRDGGGHRAEPARARTTPHSP